MPTAPASAAMLVDVELRIAGRVVAAPRHLAWSESALHGAALSATFIRERGAAPRLGDVIELKWKSGHGPETEGNLRLWCRAVTAFSQDGLAWLQLEATDPLGFCSEETQFRSHAGRGAPGS